MSGVDECRRYKMFTETYASDSNSLHLDMYMHISMWMIMLKTLEPFWKINTEFFISKLLALF